MGLPEALRPIPVWALWLAGVTAFRLLFGALVPLTPEEAYHWNYAVHPDWSYYDHPPMIAWAIAAGRLLFGDTALGVRFVPILFSVGTACVLARLARRLYGERAAVWTIWLLMLEPIMLGAAGAGFPDSPLLFFWTLALSLAWKAIETRRGPVWIAAGASLGAALLSKYTAAFFGLGMLAYLLVSKRDRRILLSPWPYLGALVALIVFSPVIFWNWAHDWVSFHYQSVNRLRQADEVNLASGIKFVGQQWLGVIPLLMPLAVVGAWRALSSERAAERYLFWLLAPMLGFFFILGWTRAIHLLWPLPAYLGLTVLMAGIVVRCDTSLARFYESKRSWLLGSFAVGVVLTTCHAAFFLPYLSPIQGLYGWEKVALQTRRLREEMPPETFVLGIGRKYTVPSQLAFHLREPANVHGKNLLGQMGLQYDFWADPRSLKGRDAVVVLEAGDRSDRALDLLRKHFRSVDEAGEVVVPVGRMVLVRPRPLRFTLLRARDYQPHDLASPRLFGRATD